MEISFFAYKTGNSLFHRLNTGIKLLFLIGFSLLLFFAVPHLIMILAVLFLPLFLLLSPSVRDTLRDILPTIYYGVFMGIVSSVSFSTGFEQQKVIEILPFILRVILIAAAASLIYRTTSPLQLRMMLEQTETVIRSFLRLKNRKPELAGLFALYLMFIPRVFENWTKIEYAWKARGGKNGPKKILRLLPVLFSVCLQNAYETARALQNRTPD